MQAFLVDIFHGLLQDRSVIFAAGRLENGETFGLMDDRVPPCFYIRSSDATVAQPFLKKHAGQFLAVEATTMDGEAVQAITTPTVRQQRFLEKDLDAAGIRTYEADLDYAMAFRIARQIKGMVKIEGTFRSSQFVNRFYVNPELTPVPGTPNLRVLVFDIETDSVASQLYGFSLVSWDMQGGAELEEVHLVEAGVTEKDLLVKFRERLLAIDPDIVTGWNVIDFDLTVLAKLFGKYRLEFNLGRTKEASFARLSQYFGHNKMILRGRQVIDSLQLVRHSLSSFEDLRLNTVAQELLGRGKTLEVEEWQSAPAAITDAFQNNRAAFCEYVLEDSRLVRDILRREGLLELTLARSMLTSLPLEKGWGSVAAFETLYMSAMRARRMVAPTRGIDSSEEWGSSGGLILQPVVGLHEHVLVFDFKSLYPSVMRTFNIDPIAFVQGQQLDPAAAIRAPNGALFARDPAILPEILHQFFAHRAAAKDKGNARESYCYKIVMNSFYGVLGTDSCRFADRDLADAITGFGQKLLLWMQSFFQSSGFTVLYGDTDSLFVAAPQLASQDIDAITAFGRDLCLRANKALAEALRQDYQVDSHMELEFEEYDRFLFLPSDRQGDGSRAKNYAALEINAKGRHLKIKGMEAVRSDWTPLAKNLQKALLGMLFDQADPHRMVATIRALIRSLSRTQDLSEFIYRKRIRRPLESYTRTTPPHIKAARLLPGPVRVVRYVMTTRGPQPLGFVTAPLDHEHYIKKQIMPIVEGIAAFAGFSADEACSLFGGFDFGAGHLSELNPIHSK